MFDVRCSMFDVPGFMGSLPRHRHTAGAGQIQDAEALHQDEKFLDLAFIAGDFHRQSLRLHVHNLGAENVRDLHHFRAGFGIHGPLQEHSSRSTYSPWRKSCTLMTSGSLLSCLTICSSVASSPWV